MKIIAIIISLLFFKVEIVSSQSYRDKYAFLLEAGNKEFDAFHYKYALTFYQEYLKKNGSSNETLQLIGDCYYKMLSYDSALQTYTALPEKNISVLEKIAELYAWKQDYSAAKKTYIQLISQTKSAARNIYYSERITGFDKVSNFYKDSLDWKVQFLSINTVAREYSPFIFQQGLLFVSNRKTDTFQTNTYGWDGGGFDDIYLLKDRSTLFEINPNSIKKEFERNIKFLIDKAPVTNYDNNTLTEKIIKSIPGAEVNGVSLFEKKPQLKGNVGPISISGDGNTIYFTRNRSEKTNGVHLLEICKIEKTLNGWGKAMVLSLNVATASSFHPFINASGTRLYFASNREGGFGGADIYKIEKLNEITWSVPENMGPSVNTQGDEVFPSEKKNKLFFSLFEINPNSIKKELERNIKFLIDKTPPTSNDNNTLTKKIIKSKPGSEVNGVSLFEKKLQFKGNVGPISISGDGNTVYFSRNRSKKTNGVHLLEICKIEKTLNGWGKAIVLSSNVTKASSFHPFINASGTRLYFASDREGGFGGSDIYKIEKLNEKTWSKPENMGPSVNTQGDEVFPSENKNKLFFSSNGWGGLGGLDLFETSEIPYKKPSNLGYPINSSSDDFGYISNADGKEGFFSSNRYGNDDLFGYSFEKYFCDVKGIIMDIETKKIKQGVKLKLNLLDEGNNKVLVDSTVTDSLGQYKFNIRPNEKYLITLDETPEIRGDNSGEILTDKKQIDKGIWLIHVNKAVIKKVITPTVSTE